MPTPHPAMTCVIKLSGSLIGATGAACTEVVTTNASAANSCLPCLHEEIFLTGIVVDLAQQTLTQIKMALAGPNAFFGIALFLRARQAYGPIRHDLPPCPRKLRRHCEYAHRLLLQAVGLTDQSMPVAYSDDGLPSAADCPRHAIYARCAEFCQVRLQTSFNSAAARLHASAHRSDVAAAFIRNCRCPDQ